MSNAEDAGKWVSEYTTSIDNYIKGGLIGDDLRIAKLEEAAKFYDSSSVLFDVADVHNCYTDNFILVKGFLDTNNPKYESRFDVLEVIEVDDTLWIVKVKSTQFISGIGDIVDETEVYVSNNGIVGSTLEPEDEETPCWAGNTKLTDKGKHLNEEANQALGK